MRTQFEGESAARVLRHDGRERTAFSGELGRSDRRGESFPDGLRDWEVGDVGGRLSATNIGGFPHALVQPGFQALQPHQEPIPGQQLEFFDSSKDQGYQLKQSGQWGNIPLTFPIS